ncbi:MAG: hypothetical protein ACK5KO_07915 [Arachnia sp.]
MSALIHESEVPEISGDPGALETAATDLTTAQRGLDTTCSSVIGQWRGLNPDNYKAPETSTVMDSIPKIQAPTAESGAALSNMAAGLTEAAGAIARLKADRLTLITEIRALHASYESFKATTSAEDEAAPGVDAADAVFLGISQALRARVATLKTELERAANDLQAAVDIPAPTVDLPEAEFVAGKPGATYSSQSGPDAWAESGHIEKFENGNFRSGDAAAAKAQLFDLHGAGSKDTGFGVLSGNYKFAGLAHAEAVNAYSVGVDGAHWRAAAGAGVGVEAAARGAYTAGPVSVDAGIGGKVVAEVGAAAQFGTGPDGASGKIGVHGFAGAKATADVGVDVAGVKGTLGADVRYGIGVDAEVGGAVGWDKVSLNLDLGIAVGAGAGVKADITFSPKQLLENSADAMSKLGTLA